MNVNITMEQEKHKSPPITLSWQNINVHTPSSKDDFAGKLLFCKKEVPGKHIVKDGKNSLIASFFCLY